MLKGTVMQKKLVFECFWNAWHGSAIEMFMARMKNGIAWLHVCCFWETTFLRSLTVLMCDIMLSNRKTSICDIVCCLRENYWIVWVRPFQCIYIVWIQTCCVVCEKTNRHSIARIFISRSGSKIVFPVSQLVLRRSQIVRHPASLQLNPSTLTKISSGEFDIPKMKQSSLRNERFMIQCWKDQLSERWILRKKYNYHSDMERSVSLGISR